MRTGSVDLSWSGWQWAVSVDNLVNRPPTGRGLAGSGRMGACCWKVGQLESERKRSNQSAVFQAGEPSAWANHLQCLELYFVQPGSA